MFHTTRRRAAAAAAAVTVAGGLTLAGFAASASAAPLPPKHHAECALNGPNVVSLTDGGITYTYPAHFDSDAAGHGVQVVSGWLRDGYEPVPLILPLHGVAFTAGGTCDIVFSAAYPTTGPDAGAQGVRTFSGAVSHDHLKGAVSETGTEDLATSFSLLFHV